MKRTTTINLAGLVFHIEEDGFQILNTYFDELKRIFSKQDGGTEILHDIEARFAELFKERTNEPKQVVTLEDVHETIEIMGSPQQFEDDDTSSEETNKQNFDETNSTTHKRLYRDKDNAVIGGVASGLGHYFNIDPVFIRIIWILFVFVGGTGILAYIIALIAIPEAKTTSEKLHMQGKTVNVDSIKNFADTVGNEAKKGINKAAEAVKSSLINGVGRKIIRFFGMIFLIGGLIGFVATVAFFVINPNTVFINDQLVQLDVNSAVNLFFAEESLSYWSIFIISIIPLLLIILFGTRLLVGQRLRLKTFTSILVGIWVIAIITITVLSIKSGLDFNEKYSSENTVYIQEPIQELGIKLIENKTEITSSEDVEFNNSLIIEKDSIALGYVNIEIIPTKDSVFYYTITQKSSGRTLKTAKANADAIQSSIIAQDSLLKIDSQYRIPKHTKYRDQKVSVMIYVPIEKTIKIYGNLEDYPVKIHSLNPFNKDDVERTSTWKSTDRGMVLIYK